MTSDAPQRDSPTRRGALGRISEILERRADFRPRYEAARRVVRIFRRPSFYEISQRCNLKCEGCYYFEDESRVLLAEERSADVWDAFFQSEARRHVSMAYFVGAEPALEQERLIAASRWLPYGNVGTNGVVRIDPEVRFRISISVWGVDDKTDRTLRGASAFRKAFRNYRGDPRAAVYYTLSRWNLDGVRLVAEMCRDNGLPLTFNMYSPTTTYLAKLSQGVANDRDFFRVSQAGDTPMLDAEDLARARRAVLDCMEAFPETVLYSRAYNEWATSPEPMHEVDETGLATNCGSRILQPMNYYGPNIATKTLKCCTPDLDCSQCRIMSGGWSTVLQPRPRHLASEEGFGDWLEMVEAVSRIFIYERPQSEPGTGDAPAAAAVMA